MALSLDICILGHWEGPSASRKGSKYVPKSLVYNIYLICFNVIWWNYMNYWIILYGIKKHAHLCRLRDVLHSTLTDASFLFRLILETSDRTANGASLTKAKRGEPCKPIPRTAIQTVWHTVFAGAQLGVHRVQKSFHAELKSKTSKLRIPACSFIRSCQV